MRVPILGGPHDGAFAVIPEHTELGTKIKVGGSIYKVEMPQGKGPRLTPWQEKTDG